MTLLCAGADTTIKGSSGESQLTPALIARTSNTGSPSLADAVDAEVRLRSADPERVEKLRSRQISEDEFKTSLREELANAGCQT
jgi:hypothetical protein